MTAEWVYHCELIFPAISFRKGWEIVFFENLNSSTIWVVIGFNNNACLFELKLYWFLVTNAFLYVFVPSCLCVLVTGEFSVHKNDINQVVPYPSQLPSTKRQNLLSFGIKNVKSSHCAEFFRSRACNSALCQIRMKAEYFLEMSPHFVAFFPSIGVVVVATSMLKYQQI